jgi:Reverse transcriptase (RNA-dependent DNA polymerase).
MDFKKGEIADFENGQNDFHQRLQSLASSLLNDDWSYFSSLLNQVDFEVLPKLTLEKKPTNDDNLVVSNSECDSLKISKVNFFISLPVELSIIDVLWTLLFACLCKDGGNPIEQYSYANLIDDGVFIGERNEYLKRVNFQTYKLFAPYFSNYLLWKNNAIEYAEKNYESEEDCTIFSLDLKEFFYSVDVDFVTLPSLSEADEDSVEEFKKLSFLTRIIQQIHSIYSKKISKVRKGIDGKTILPIGLPSSGYISNLYMLDFDRKISHVNGVGYYGRYVDDILIVKNGATNVSDSFDLLLSTFPGIFKQNSGSNSICLFDSENITIQKSKVKVIKVFKDYSESILTRLKTDIATPSEPRLMPNIDLSLDDFQKLVYGGPNESIKVRDATKPDINQKYLMKYLSDYLFGHKNTFKDENRNEPLTKREREIQEQIKKTLSTTLLLHLYPKWGLIFAFAFLYSSDKKLFVDLVNRAKDAVSDLAFSSEESSIFEVKKTYVLDSLRRSLRTCLDIAISSSFALTLNGKGISSTITTKTRETGKRLRKSNMFNLRLCAFPMLSFSKKQPKNLYSVDLEKYLSRYNQNEIDRSKLSLSPSFLRPQDFFIFNAMKEIDSLNSLNYKNIYSQYLAIYKDFGFTDEPLMEIKLPSGKDYKKVEVLTDPNKGLKNRNEMVYVAIGNMNLSKHGMIRNNHTLDFRQTSFKRKKELYRLLSGSYLPRYKGLVNQTQNPENSKDNIEADRKEALFPVDFLVLPEASVPLEWLPEIAEFSRRSQIAVICGIKYVPLSTGIVNSVATILPLMSQKKHRSAFVFLREKNFYAPEEKQRIVDSNHLLHDPKTILNYVFDWRDVRFSVFNCYELTDIMSRAVVTKDYLDLLIATEYNKDVAYFSNITESASRDLFCYVCQVNSSNFGDSKIIAPLRGYRKTIASISGGEKDTIHIAGINISTLRKFLSEEYDPPFIDYGNSVKKAENTARLKNKEYAKLLDFNSTSANKNKQ